MKLMKGLGATSFFAFLLVFGTGSSTTVANSAELKPSLKGQEFIAQTKEEQAWSDYVEQEVERKMFEAFQDAFETFDIDTSDYTYYSLHSAPKSIKEIQSSKNASLLKRAAIDAITNIITSGDFMPGLFVHKDGNKAFITFKEQESGKNHVYWLTLDPNKKASINAKGVISNVWEVTSEEAKEGKKLEELNVKSLREFIGQP
ncbi:hypothetical protein [Brevibacillus borstelensis]|uniref:hypothetical protein n=1 Tax=Brevibacillus borstelensis TaxID=45462 RepID=UPI0030BFCBD9